MKLASTTVTGGGGRKSKQTAAAPASKPQHIEVNVIVGYFVTNCTTVLSDQLLFRQLFIKLLCTLVLLKILSTY